MLQITNDMSNSKHYEAIKRETEHNARSRNYSERVYEPSK